MPPMEREWQSSDLVEIQESHRLAKRAAIGVGVSPEPQSPKLEMESIPESRRSESWKFLGG